MDWKVLQCHRGTLLHCLVERQFSSKFGLLSHRSENSIQQAKKKRKYQNFYVLCNMGQYNYWYYYFISFYTLISSFKVA